MPVYYKHGECVKYDKTVVALGTFDGLHIAHMKIINKAKDYAAKNSINCGVLMFDKIPANLFSKQKTPMLMRLSDKYEFLDNMDFIYEESFDNNFASMSPEEFVMFLKNKLNAVAVSLGYNYRFGKFAGGDVKLLEELCTKHNIKVLVEDKNSLSGEDISSTRIRNLILAGDVSKANTILGRPFFLSGIVNHGFRNGTQMGIPTANLTIDKDVIIPHEGVYYGFCRMGDKRYSSVINIGKNPTFDGKSLTVECHLLDFSDEIYNREIKVYFLGFIRNEIKFDDCHKLIEQINKDIEFAREELKKYVSCCRIG